MTTTLDFIVDDFAAAGGWEQGIRQAGFTGRMVGVEFEKWAVETARAAGHERVHGDVRVETSRLIDLLIMRHSLLGRRIIWLYIASPPCQTFSAAGKGAGRQHLDALLKAVEYVATGMTPESAIEFVSDEKLDERSVLVLHPLQMIRRHRPTFVMLEQVKEALPIWKAYAEWLRQWGYSVRTEVVKAEQYGVPQTRRRAVLVASLLHDEAPWPVASHSAYHSHNKAKRDEGVPSFVTMAQALEWGMTHRPSMTVCGGGTETGGAEPFAKGSREGMQREQEAGRWLMGDVARKNGTMRDVETEPAATLPASMDNGNFRFVQESNYSAGGKPGQTAAERGLGTRDALTEPSSTVTSKGFRWVPVAANEGTTAEQMEWSETRPSPTVVGSYEGDVLAAPGYRKAGDPPRQKTPGSIRVTPEEAAVLQTFPEHYPWQGGKNAKHQQIGNAVPPLLAQRLYEAVVA